MFETLIRNIKTSYYGWKEEWTEKTADHPPLETIYRAFRIWRNREFVRHIKHDEIVTQVADDAVLKSRYSFMVVMSCGIAILGLLLSSPAVIIGAMLISPLMGPIAGLGFSLTDIDFRQMKRSLEAIIVGTILAVLISYLVVKISPITDATPEILARTRPNLFDLLVAVFSGLAGAYATIYQRGGTIVGVAIATALMPPLAVVGYGLATASWTIAGGASFLFMTNLLAIALSFAIMAKWYGFGRRHSPSYTLWQSLLTVTVFVILSIPLGISLMDIAYQSYFTKSARSQIDTLYEDAYSRITAFNVRFDRDDSVYLEAVVVTDKPVRDVNAKLSDSLKTQARGTVLSSVDQVILSRAQQKQAEAAENVLPAATVSVPLDAAQIEMNTSRNIEQRIRQSISFEVSDVLVDPETRTASIFAANDRANTFSSLRAGEANISGRFEGWNIQILPTIRALPYLYFETGSVELNDDETEKLEDILWALQRWNIEKVEVIGFASSTGAGRSINTRLAEERAENIAKLLNEGDIEAVSRSDYLSNQQITLERELGRTRFQRVEIRLLPEEGE
ncbi:MAG: TIGR00341 family protein [Alphaproteobacteria bacterium]|nr:TIGR00341 family protein [Alphaproteobacteria bacterium]